MPEGADAARAGMRLLEISRTLEPWIPEETAAHGAFFGWDADRNFTKHSRKRVGPITTSPSAQMERDDVQALCKRIIDAIVPADQNVTGLYVMNLDRNGPVRLASLSKTASLMHAFVLDAGDCDDDGLIPDACHYIWQESPNGRSVLGPLGYNYVSSTYPCPNILAKATDAITGEYVPFMGIGVEVAPLKRLMFRRGGRVGVGGGREMQVAIVGHASPYPFLDSKSMYKPLPRQASQHLEAAGFRLHMGTDEADAEPPKPSRHKPKRSHSAVEVENALQVFDSGASSSRVGRGVPRQRQQLAAIPIELASLEQPPSQEQPQLAASPIDFSELVRSFGNVAGVALAT
jgi:hypothetical protein